MNKLIYAIRDLSKPSLPYNYVCRRIPEAQIIHCPSRPTYCLSLAFSQPAWPSSLLSSFHSLPAAPPAGKAEKDSIGAKPVVHSNGPGFSPVDFSQGPMEGTGNTGNPKDRDLTFLKFYILPHLRKMPSSGVRCFWSVSQHWQHPGLC